MRSLRTALRLAVVLAAAATSGGCYAVSTVLTINGNGSGTIRQRVLVTPAAQLQIRGLASRDRSAPAFDLVSVQQARSRATTFGAGVTYLSSTAIDGIEGLGRDITYGFTDITQVRLDEQPPALDGTTDGPPRNIAAQISFTLARGPGGTVQLHVKIPQPNVPAQVIRPGSDGLSPDQVAMFRQMLTGGRLSIALEPAGEFVRTNGRYVDGRRVTLVDIDFDALSRNETALLRLQESTGQETIAAMLQDLPGAKVTIEPEITIEFTPER